LLIILSLSKDKLEFSKFKCDGLEKSRLTGPAAGTGVQGFVNYMRLLDSGFRRNDDLYFFSTFYGSIKCIKFLIIFEHLKLGHLVLFRTSKFVLWIYILNNR